MSTGERAAGGLEALQRECLRQAKDFDVTCGDSEVEAAYYWCADALAPHIAAAKEREEKLWALAGELRAKANKFKELAGKAAALHNTNEYIKWMAKVESIEYDADRLAAILGGDDGGKA